MFEAFRLKGAVGGDMSMDLDDTLATKKALHSLGHFQTPSYGLTGYPDRAMVEGLKSFQRANGLKVDGVMRPDGPTVRKLNAALVARQDTPPPQPPKDTTSPIVPTTPTPTPSRPPLTLRHPVKASASVELGDALKVKAALASLGLLRPPKDGLSPYPDHAMIDGIKAFQRHSGLRVDGEMAPDGPTVRKLNAALQVTAGVDEKSATQRSPAAADGAQVAQVVVPSGATPLIPDARGVSGPAGTPDAAGGLPPSYRYRGPDIDWAGAWSRLPEEMQSRILQVGSLPLATKTFLEGLEAGGGDKRSSPKPSTPTARTQIADPLPPVPPSKLPHDEDRPPNKTTLPRPRPDDLGPPTEIFPDPEERREYIESFPDQSDLLLDYLTQENSRGDDETQADNDFIIKEMGACLDTMGLRWTHTHGAHDKRGNERKERYIHPTSGIGAARPDISIEIEGGGQQNWYEDFQTVTTWKDGQTLVARERRAMQKIIDLKAAHGERGAVKAFPKSRGINRPQWETEMRKAVWDYCDARYRRYSKISKGRGPAGTSR